MQLAEKLSFSVEIEHEVPNEHFESVTRVKVIACDPETAETGMQILLRHQDRWVHEPLPLKREISPVPPAKVGDRFVVLERHCLPRYSRPTESEPDAKAEHTNAGALLTSAVEQQRASPISEVSNRMHDLPTGIVCKAMAGLKRKDFKPPLYDSTVYERVLTGKKSRVGKIDRFNRKVDFVWEDGYNMKLIERDDGIPSVDELMSMDVAPLKEAFSWSFLCNDHIYNLKEAQDWMRERIRFLEEQNGVKLGTQPLEDIGRYVQIGPEMIDMHSIPGVGSNERN